MSTNASARPPAPAARQVTGAPVLPHAASYSTTKALRLKSLVLLLAMLPLLLALTAVVWVVGAQLQALASTQKESVGAILNQARHDELARLVDASVRAIVDRFPDGAANPANAEARPLALAYLRSLTAGDSYFFVYDIHGQCLADAGDPSNNNKPCIDLRDDQGVFVVQRLIGQALGGGGHLEHTWIRPTTGKVERKLSYAKLLPRWNWVVGAGLYQDTLRQADLAITQSSDDAVEGTRSRIVAIASLALLAVGAGGLLLNVQEQRKADVKLRRMHQRSERAAQDARAAVGLDLHDSLQQSILGCKLMVEAATRGIESGSGDGLQQLHVVIDDLAAAGIEVREVSKELTLPTLRNCGLKAALEEAAYKLDGRVVFDLVLSLEDAPSLAFEVARDLLMFARQAIYNVQVHADASRVELTLRFDPRQGLTLQVEDNGKGFDVAAVMRRPRDGLGLTSMRERIEMLGGQFSIVSNPGARRTVVLAKLPLHVCRASVAA